MIYLFMVMVFLYMGDEISSKEYLDTCMIRDAF